MMEFECWADAVTDEVIKILEQMEDLDFALELYDKIENTYTLEEKNPEIISIYEQKLTEWYESEMDLEKAAYKLIEAIIELDSEAQK